MFNPNELKIKQQCDIVDHNPVILNLIRIAGVGVVLVVPWLPILALMWLTTQLLS